MAYLFGALLGGTMFGYIFAAIAGRLFFRVLPPDEKAYKAAFVAGAFVMVIAGFGLADGIGFNPFAAIMYIPGLLIAWAWLRANYRKAWRDDESDIFE